MASHSYCTGAHTGEIVSCRTYGAIKLLEDVVLWPRNSYRSRVTLRGKIAEFVSIILNFRSAPTFCSLRIVFLLRLVLPLLSFKLLYTFKNKGHYRDAGRIVFHTLYKIS